MWDDATVRTPMPTNADYGRPTCRMIAAVFLIVASATLTVIGQSRAFDIVIRGGRVVDGTGSPWFVADIGIKGDSIAAVATHLDPAGAKVIDATGLVVAPGFIDVHSHSEPSAGGPGILGVPRAENNIRQGVTTVFNFETTQVILVEPGNRSGPAREALSDRGVGPFLMLLRTRAASATLGYLQEHRIPVYSQARLPNGLRYVITGPEAAHGAWIQWIE